MEAQRLSTPVITNAHRQCGDGSVEKMCVWTKEQSIIRHRIASCAKCTWKASTVAQLDVKIVTDKIPQVKFATNPNLHYKPYFLLIDFIFSKSLGASGGNMPPLSHHCLGNNLVALALIIRELIWNGSSPGTHGCYLTGESSTFKLRKSACGMVKQQGMHRRTLTPPALHLPWQRHWTSASPLWGTDPTVYVCVSSFGSAGEQEVVNSTDQGWQPDSCEQEAFSLRSATERIARPLTRFRTGNTPASEIRSGLRRCMDAQ